jgi:hypothetical protein
VEPDILKRGTTTLFGDENGRRVSKIIVGYHSTSLLLKQIQIKGFCYIIWGGGGVVRMVLIDNKSFTIFQYY